MKFLITLLLVLAPAQLFAQSVTLAWDANIESTVVGYVVSQGSASGNYSSTIEVPGRTTTSVVIPISNPTTPVYFAVKAKNAAGVLSAFSAEVVKAAAQVPCAMMMTTGTFTLPPTGGSVPLTITTTRSDCLWQLSVNVPWLSVMPASGVGNGTAVVSAFLNTAPARTGSVMGYDGAIVSYTQATAPLPPPLPCGVGLLPTVTVETYNNRFKLGQSGRIVFTLGASSGRDISKVVAYFGNGTPKDVWTTNVTSGGLWIRGAGYTPTTKGAFRLWVQVTDTMGCIGSTGTVRTVTVE